MPDRRGLARRAVDGDGDVDICSKPWNGSLHVYLRNLLVESGGKPIKKRRTKGP